ncbi:MAG: protein kinase [Candidatus Sericytochromatia bacterium]|nr:protein kinase [Candidatus Sericytochromatia bacterium]
MTVQLRCPCCGRQMPSSCRYCAICGARLPPALQAGVLVAGRYQVLRVLTVQGHHLSTYQALDKSSGETVTLKELRDDLRTDPASQHQLREELKHLCALRIAGVPPIQSVIRHEDRAYLVCSFVPGHTLRQLMARQGRLSLEQARALLQGVAQILVQLHREFPPMLHLDINPDNILLTAWHEATLIDPSWLKALGLPYAHRPPFWTEAYAAPEALRAQAGPASDLYSLGVTVLEAVTGIPAPRLQHPTTNQMHWDDLPDAGLQKLLLALVEPQPANRLESAERLLAYLHDPRTPLTPGGMPRAVAPQAQLALPVPFSPPVATGLHGHPLPPQGVPPAAAPVSPGMAAAPGYSAPSPAYASPVPGPAAPPAYPAPNPLPTGPAPASFDPFPPATAPGTYPGTPPGSAPAFDPFAPTPATLVPGVSPAPFDPFASASPYPVAPSQAAPPAAYGAAPYPVAGHPHPQAYANPPYPTAPPAPVAAPPQAYVVSSPAPPPVPAAPVQPPPPVPARNPLADLTLTAAAAAELRQAPPARERENGLRPRQESGVDAFREEALTSEPVAYETVDYVPPSAPPVSSGTPLPARRRVPVELIDNIDDMSTEDGLEALLALYEEQNL